MKEHTPGPWSWDGPTHNIHVREEARPHMRVCFLTSDGPTEANANLIAAAPNLLAALKLVVSQIEDYERVNNLAPNPGRKHCWDSVALAHETIAIAEGRTLSTSNQTEPDRG